MNCNTKKKNQPKNTILEDYLNFLLKFKHNYSPTTCRGAGFSGFT